MNTIFRFACFATLTLVSLFWQGCSDDDPVTPTPTSSYELSFVVNGGGFTNKTFTLTGGAANYATAEDVIQIAFAGKDGSTDVGFSGFWKGTSTGSRQIVYEQNDDTVSCGFTHGQKVYGCTAGTMALTKFGGVGGDVEGTFSGTFTLFFASETVTVTNGRFKVKRIF